MGVEELKREIKKAAHSERAERSKRFFKTGRGQYGEGDVFAGLTVPQSKDIAKKFRNLSLKEINHLLKSEIHEERLIALLILVDKYQNEQRGKEIFDFYINNIEFVNNWDLVDLSADKIVGEWLLNKDKDTVYELSKSNHLWTKRISIVSTFAFIRKNEFEPTLKISEILLKDRHDLIHKAVGWMLREVGKRDEKILEDFLKKHYENIHRTTLRYAIERFDEKKRKSYLSGNFSDLSFAKAYKPSKFAKRVNKNDRRKYRRTDGRRASGRNS